MGPCCSCTHLLTRCLLSTLPYRTVLPGGAGAEDDINSQLGVGSVAADAELDAMKEQVR